jgi:hypothetical protein
MMAMAVGVSTAKISRIVAAVCRPSCNRASRSPAALSRYFHS